MAAWVVDLLVVHESGGEGERSPVALQCDAFELVSRTRTRTRTRTPP